ncbi:M56 family metallopeptidase [Dysgonomonas sp. Marseille-P4361]|uniref:M56 family metallopeptidase n=1 Tax=Dysgonomonas sp. Marseille-P4361 TaxID=2161820 RepID=UPI00135BE227|nr:M56 family metallopeptidase [Dysgonomonas sp. Marseille-P4361]
MILIGFCLFALLIPFIELNIGRWHIHDTINRYETFLANTSSEYINQYQIGTPALNEKGQNVVPFADERIVPEKTEQFANLTLVNIILLLYLVGIVFFSIKIIYPNILIIRLIYKYKKRKLGKVRLIIHDENYTPFSWMNYIIISRTDYVANGKMIIQHELAHVKQFHAIDLVIIKLLTILQWYNPAMWLIDKELQDIHEYEADSFVIDSGIDAKQYQLLLIKETVGSSLFNSMTNSLNHSKLKKRITMMLKEKSKTQNRWKYLLILPLVAISVATFAYVEIPKGIEGIPSAEINEKNQERKKIEGTWRLVETKNFDQSTNDQSVKLITEDSFVWYRYDADGNVLTGAGGKYTFENGEYVEQIDFTLPTMKYWKGKKAVVKIEFKDNRMICNGVLDGKVNIVEEWERVK